MLFTNSGHCNNDDDDDKDNDYDSSSLSGALQWSLCTEVATKDTQAI